MLKLNTTRAAETIQLQNTAAAGSPNPVQAKLQTPLGPTGHRLSSGSNLNQVKQPGQFITNVLRGAKNLAAGAAMTGLVFGLSGCNLGETPTEPRPYEPIEMHTTADDSSVAIGYTGETKIAADLRIALHKSANANHEGSRSRLFLDHAGEDRQLSSGEFQTMMENAQVGSTDIGRMLGAKAAIALRDANKDGKLSYGEFKPVVYAPSEIAEGK